MNLSTNSTCSLSSREQWACSPYEPAEAHMLRDLWWARVYQAPAGPPPPSHTHTRTRTHTLRGRVNTHTSEAALVLSRLTCVLTSRLSPTFHTSSPVRGCCKESTPSSKTRYPNLNTKPLRFVKYSCSIFTFDIQKHDKSNHTFKCIKT